MVENEKKVSKKASVESNFNKQIQAMEHILKIRRSMTSENTVKALTKIYSEINVKSLTEFEMPIYNQLETDLTMECGCSAMRKANSRIQRVMATLASI